MDIAHKICMNIMEWRYLSFFRLLCDNEPLLATCNEIGNKENCDKSVNLTTMPLFPV